MCESLYIDEYSTDSLIINKTTTGIKNIYD